VTWAEASTPGYPDKTSLYRLSNGHTYPSALGLAIIMADALQEWRALEGHDAGQLRWLDMYPSLAAFQTAYDANERIGQAIPPAAGAEKKGAWYAQASTMTMLGVAAVGIGLVYLVIRKK
jgi:hypothetical protein